MPTLDKRNGEFKKQNLSMKPWPKVAVITPGHFQTEGQILARAQALYQLGLRMLVLREPKLARHEALALEGELAVSCPDLRLVHHLKCPGSAQALGAPKGNFHFPAHRTLKGLGVGQAGGVSTHNREELERAICSGAAYAFFGPVWLPNSKPRDTREPLGPQEYRRMLEEFSLPIYALGGVNAQRCAGLRGLAKLRVALIGKLFTSPWAQAREEFSALLETLGR